MPTHQRRDLLAHALDSIERLDPAPGEVVVVSDGSTDGSDDVVRSRGLRLVRTEHVGAAGARNAGWRATSADVIAFLDDDCAADPGWLGALVAPFADDDDLGLVQGRTVPAGPMGPHDRAIHVEAERGLYESCNIAYRREALAATGGFDERWAQRFGGRPFGEDTDLAWRARRLGWRTAFADDAVVRHHVFPGTLADTLREQRRLGGFPLLVALVPELRDLLPGGRYFLRRHGPLAQAALLAPVVALRSRRLAVAMALPYAAWLLRRQREPGALARQVVGDAVGSASLLAGSVRHRSLVL